MDNTKTRTKKNRKQDRARRDAAIHVVKTSEDAQVERLMDALRDAVGRALKNYSGRLTVEIALPGQLAGREQTERIRSAPLTFSRYAVTFSDGFEHLPQAECATLTEAVTKAGELYPKLPARQSIGIYGMHPNGLLDSVNLLRVKHLRQMLK